MKISPSNPPKVTMENAYLINKRQLRGENVSATPSHPSFSPWVTRESRRLRREGNPTLLKKLGEKISIHPSVHPSIHPSSRMSRGEGSSMSREWDRVKGSLSNLISPEDVRPGDHIYSWRSAYIYAHHGIYVGEEMVIHFGNDGREIGTGTSFDGLIWGSWNSDGRSGGCEICKDKMRLNLGVMKSCIRCFLSGGDLYRFEYSTPRPIYQMKLRGLCTMVPSDPADEVIHRAEYLLENGFGKYNLVSNNCEDFAIYCKTSFIVLGSGGVFGPSSQVQSIKAGVFSFVGSLVRGGFTAFSIFDGFRNFCDDRCNSDIDRRARKISLEHLPRVLTTESSFNNNPTN